MSDLPSIHAKIDRAKEHLLRLDGEVGAYLDTEPITVVRQIQPDRQTSAFAVKVTEQPSVLLGVLVGEIAHQLRSALDHMAYRLVLAAGNSPTKRTSFPICVSRPQSLNVSGGVTPEVLARVDEVQPYQLDNPEGHPLHLLNELWNIDKHRNLHLTVSMLRNTQIFLGLADGSSVVGGQFQSGTLGDDGIIGVFEFPGGVVDHGLEVIGMSEQFVALGDPGPWPNDIPVAMLLENLYNYVSQEMLGRFEHLL